MGIIDKIEAHKEQDFTEEELKDIFGEDYRSRCLGGVFSNAYELIFEDSGKLYLTEILEIDEDLFGNQNPKPYSLSARGFKYKELDNILIIELSKRLERARKEVRIIESALSHERYRLKASLE